MRYTFLLLGFLFPGLFAFPQAIQEGVFASSADEVIKDEVQMVWILGDTFVGSLVSESASLVQGLAYYSQVDLATSNTRIYIPELKIYPNPASDYVWIEGVPSEKSWSLKLLTLHGQVLESQRLLPFSTNEISLAGLPSGVYLIYIKNQDGLSHPFSFLKR